jgi:hypothetical protein
LQKAFLNKAITVCNASGLPHDHVPSGQALKDAVVHIDELNRWAGTLSGGQRFLMQESTETGALSDALGIEFTIPLMPTEIPSEFLKLPLDAMITYSTGMSVGHTGGRTSIGGLIELIRERIDLRAKGRYSLKDAARLLEVEAGEDGRQMLEALIDDAVEGEFAVHQPGKNATFNATRVARSSAWRLEAVSGTLNRWLETKHPLIRFRFQDPPLVEPSCSAQPAGVLLGLGADVVPVCEGNQRQRPAEGGESKNGMTRRWTPDFTAEVQAYRDQHGTTAAANHFKVSTTVIKSKTKAKRAAQGTPANPAFSILTTGFIDRRR